MAPHVPEHVPTTSTGGVGVPTIVEAGFTAGKIAAYPCAASVECHRRVSDGKVRRCDHAVGWTLDEDDRATKFCNVDRFDRHAWLHVRIGVYGRDPVGGSVHLGQRVSQFDEVLCLNSCARQVRIGK